MDQDNKLCISCSRGVAEFYCSCTDPATFLCEGCLGKHSRLASLKGHQTWPVSLPQSSKNPLYSARLQALPLVREEAMGCIGEVERAITEVTARVQELQAALTLFGTEKVRELQDMKVFLSREISKALEEVERTLAEEQPLLVTQYGQVIRQRTESMAPLHLFACTVEICPPQALLRIAPRLITAQELNSTQLTGVFGNQAFVYDLGSQQIARHTITVNFGGGGSYVEVDRHRLVCVGADPASPAVYSLQLPSFQLIPLPFLSTPRFAAGVAKCQDQIYAFGGQNQINSVLRTCEKLHLSGRYWTSISPMAYPRGGFTPCHFRSLLYLLSAWSSQEAASPVETFNPRTDTFAVLPVFLPMQLRLGAGSVTFATDEELIFLTTKQQIARWKVDTERDFRLSSTGYLELSNQQPLIVGSTVLIVCCGGVDQFSLHTYSHLKYIT